jgi:hypothetical protein
VCEGVKKRDYREGSRHVVGEAEDNWLSLIDIPCWQSARDFLKLQMSKFIFNNLEILG